MPQVNIRHSQDIYWYLPSCRLTSHIHFPASYFILKFQYFPPDAKSQLIRKDRDAGKDWRQEEKGMAGRDSWMSSLTQRTWVWASSRRWWMTGKYGVLQSTGLQRVGHNWATEQQQAKTKSQRSLYMHTLPSLMVSNIIKQKLQEGEYSI